MVNVNLPQQALSQQDKGKIVIDPTSLQKNKMMLNIIIWNARRANNAEFKRYCNDMISLHKASMLALLETRMTNHHQLTQEPGFECLIQSTTIGLSGGINLMWKEDLLNINDISIIP